MNFKRLKDTKEHLESIRSVCDALQQKGFVDIDEKYKFSDIVLSDIAEFIMYIIAADKQINIDEVEVYRYITGYGGDDVSSIKEYIEDNGIMSYDYQSEPPVCLKLLVNALNRAFRCNDDIEGTIALTYEHLIMVYLMVGKEVFQADGNVTYSEKRDFKNYLDNIKDYISDYSYVNVDGKLSEIMDLIQNIIY